jgi:hypothetical protein
MIDEECERITNDFVDDAVQQRIVDAGLVYAEEAGPAPALVRHVRLRLVRAQADS